jgi:hypothetical protein
VRLRDLLAEQGAHRLGNVRIARSVATMASSGATLAMPSSRTVNPLPMMERARLSFSPALRRQVFRVSSLPA